MLSLNRNIKIEESIKKNAGSFTNKIAKFIVGNNLLPILIGVTLGQAGQDFILSLNENIIMGLLKPIIGDDLINLEFNYGTFNLKIGKFLKESIDFILILIILYYLFEVFLKLLLSQENEIINENKENENKEIINENKEIINENKEIINENKENENKENENKENENKENENKENKNKEKI